MKESEMKINMRKTKVIGFSKSKKIPLVSREGKTQ